MQKYIFLYIVLFFYANAFAQFPSFLSDSNNKVKEDTLYYLIVEEMPKPIGGIAGIQSGIRYTQEALDNSIQGKVYVSTFIDENGDVVKANILKGLGYGLDEISLNAVLKTKFTPGIHKGKKVKVQIVIPLLYKLLE